MNSQTAQVDKYLHKTLRQAAEDQHRGRDAQAGKRLRALLRRYPEQPDALVQLGQIAQRGGKTKEALKWTERAHASAPNDPRILYQLGMFRQILGDNDGAREAYLDCLRLAPGMAAAHDNLGVVYQHAGDFEQARLHHQKALELDPNLFGAWNNLGECERKLGRLEKAITAYERAVALNPDFDEARTNLGNAWKLTGDSKRAMACFAEVMQRQHHDSRALAEAHWQMALALLSEERFQEGWLEYEWRHHVCHLDHPNWYGVKPWQPGESPAGKHVLVTREQGIGDEIMFASCLRELQSEAADVSLECEPRLAPLIQRSFPDIEVTPAPLPNDAGRTGNFDFVIGCGSLPAIYRLSPHNFPVHSGYLKPDPQRVAHWRNKLDQLGDGVRIGITWRGGATDDNRRKRSVELADWMPILEQQGVVAVNLQYGDCRQEIETFHEQTGIRIHDWEEHDPLESLDEHAALISALDLVISIDNSTVHMAGALGKPCWVLLPAHCDWRWFRDREDSLWYPSVRLFRQLRQGEWHTLFLDVSQALAHWQPGQTEMPKKNSSRPSSQASALLFNDTTDWYHWGCTATSTALREQLEQTGLNVDRIAISELHNILTVPNNIEDFDSEDLFNEFCTRYRSLAERIMAADMIVINGEGTLHGTGPQALRLLYLTYVSRLAFGKPVHIINHSCYPEDRDTITDTLINALYKKVYAQMTSIAVREPVSARLLHQLGLPVIQSFDCLPLYLQSHAIHARERDARHILLAGSVSWDRRYLDILTDFIATLRPRGYRFTLLTGARAHMAEDDRRLVKTLQERDIEGLEILETRSTREWLQAIADAALLLSGRFHHSIAAACTGTPMIVLDSNTPKIRGLMEMLGLPEPLPYDDPKLSEKLFERFEAIVSQPDDWLVPTCRLAELRELSMNNFTVIADNVQQLTETKRRLNHLRNGETDLERWSKEENFSAHWENRARQAALWIRKGDSVLDLGCGTMTLEKHLPKGCTYIPCDVIVRDERTIVCDFNRNEFPPADDASIITVLGVLEYLNDPHRFLQWLVSCHLPVILSYCITDLTSDWNRPVLGMANHLSKDDLMALLKDVGLKVEQQTIVDNRQLLLRLCPQEQAL